MWRTEEARKGEGRTRNDREIGAKGSGNRRKDR
jgi:hypothetical protein